MLLLVATAIMNIALGYILAMQLGWGPPSLWHALQVICGGSCQPLGVPATVSLPALAAPAAPAAIPAPAAAPAIPPTAAPPADNGTNEAAAAGEAAATA